MGRPVRTLTLTLLATASVAASVPTSGVDVLARSQALVLAMSATAAPSTPTFLPLATNDVPPDVLAALASRTIEWSSLSDVMRIGMLWAYGYVLPGGGTGQLVQVYTVCNNITEDPSLDPTKGRYMDDIALQRDRFASVKCENNTCGTFFQATNDKCSAGVSAELLCAVDSAVALPASNGSFWADAGTDSTDVPYPQLYTHALRVGTAATTSASAAAGNTNANSTNANTSNAKTVTLVSIHMALSSPSPRCGSTGDAIVPCVAVPNAASSAQFCRPDVDPARLKKYLDVVATYLADVKAAAATATTTNDNEKTSSSGLSTGAVIGIVGGAVVVLGLMALYFFRQKKNKAHRDAGHDPEYPGFGRKSSNGIGSGGTRTASAGTGGASGQGFNAARSRMIQRQGTSNTFPLIDSVHDNDTVVSADYVGGEQRLDDDSRQRAYSRHQGGSSQDDSSRRTRNSSMGGSSRGAMYGKSVDEYCDESEIIREFVTDPQIKIRRIPYEDLTILRILSKGSYGEVFLGQLETRHIAMKRLLPEKKHLTKSIEQFMGEIQIMCNLEHRNIVTFVGVSWDYLQNISVIVEYMDNGDLAEVLAKSKNKFTWPKEKISISMDVAEGLVYLHSMRPVIVHRDLKSKNVLLNKRGQAKLSDFGVSRKTTVNETMTSGVGTLLWTAPEIIEGRKYSEKADIFSLGVVLSEIDTCEEPYSTVKNEETGERLPGMQIVQMVRLGELNVNFRDDCPPKLRELAQQCTSLDPDKRPTSMEVAYTLKSIIAPSLRTPASSSNTRDSNAARKPVYPY